MNFFSLCYWTVEGMIESMLKDYSRVIEENKFLNEELNNCTEVVRANFDLITTLEKEVEKLEAETENLSPILVSAGSDVSGEESDTIHSDTSKDCQIELEQVERLQQEMDAKDKAIEQLIDQLAHLKAQTVPPSTPLLEPIPNETHTMDKSAKLRAKIRDLENISLELDTVFMEKQKQLREQQAQIDELSKQLESSGTEIVDQCKKDRNEDSKILAQQLAISEEQIAILMDERKKLMEINSDLMTSISIVQTELSAYNFD